MYKLFRLCITLVLVIVLSCGSLSALALDVDTEEPPEIPEEYVHLKSVSANINVASGIARVTSSGLVSGGSDTVYVSIKLQRMTNNTWTTLKTWYGSGTGCCVVSANWNVVSGYTYRNFTTITVYTASGSYVETTYVTSSQYY